MAKSRKGEKLQLDEFGFGPELDVPDFNFAVPGVKDDRKPASKLAKGFKDGVVEHVKSPTFIRDLIRRSLPKGYGDAIKFADESAGSLRSLYNNATREVKPALNDLKRLTQRALPQGNKYLPKNVADRVKKWADSVETAGGISVDAQREASLQMQLGDIFKYQAETSARQEQEGFVKDKIKEGIDQARHRDLYSQLDAIRQATQQALAYTVGAESKYQRKSLELQFRQFFIAKDMLEEAKASNAFVKSQLELITKNTALPDFVKMQKSESLQQMMRNRFFGSLGEGLFDKRRNFVRNVGAKLGDMARERVSGFVGQLRQGIDAANMAMDMGGAGLDPYETAGGFAGGLAADYAGEKIGQRLGRRLGKNKFLNKYGNKAEQALGNIPQMAGKWAKSSKGETGIGVLDGLLTMVKDAVNSQLTGPSRKVEMDTAENLSHPAIFSRRVSKSITEIIPGFLARIYQELQIMRTGDSKTELTKYDYARNKFSGSAEAKKNAFDSLFSQFGLRNTKQQLEGFVSHVDKAGTLTPEQRADLGQQLLSANMKNQYGDRAFFTNARNFKGEHAQTYADMFSKHLHADDTGAKEKTLNRHFARLGIGMADAREKIQEHINNGELEHLVESGVLDLKTGEINLEKLQDYYSGAASYAPRGKLPGFDKGGLHFGGAAIVGEKGPELKVTGPARFYDAQQTKQLLRASWSQNPQKNSKDQLAQLMLESLLRIEMQLQSGIPTYGDADADGAALMSKVRSGLNMSLKDALQKAGGMGVRGVRGLGRLVNSVAGGIGAVFGRAGKLLGPVSQAMQKGAGTARDRLAGIRDVWIPGEAIPRLKAWKLKAGDYRDQVTGKVITSWKDLRGTVVDENGNVVLDMKELKDAFVKYGPVKKTLDAFGWVGSKLKDLANSIAGGVPTMLQEGLKASKKLFGLLSQPQDVYVRGNSEPVLLKRIMAAGGYFSKHTGKVIRHPGDIDGAVLDRDGNVALTDEELKGGVLDKYGKPIRVGLAKLFGGITDMAGKGLAMLRAGAHWAGNAASKFVGGVGNFFNKLIGPEGIVFAGGKKMVDRLTEIRNILLERLPKRKHVLGDIDGDGYREGSAEDLLRKAGPLPKIVPSMLGGRQENPMVAKLSEMVKLLKNIDKSTETTAENTEGSLLDNLPGGKYLKKLKGKGKTLMKFGGKALGLAGAAYGAYSAYDNLKQGNYGSAAVDAGLAVASGAAGVGGVGALGGLATGAGAALAAGAGAVATGLGALIGSPVLLGALAVGAVAGLGYLAYKGLTRKSLGKHSKIRYAQYGFLPSDADHLQPVFGLEDKLEKAVSWSGEQPSLDEKKVEASKLMSDFGVDEKDQRQVGAWAGWFQNRFKPVFLTHMAALRAAADGKSLADVDDFKGPQAKRYLDLSRFSDGPYGYRVSPFPGDKLLVADALLVSKLSDEALAEAGKDSKGDSKEGMTTGTAPAAVASAAAPKTLPLDQAPSIADAVARGDQTAGLSAATSGATLRVAGTFEGYQKTSSEMDALSVIRFKTYGLSEMVQEKVRALQMLEAEVGKQVAFKGGLLGGGNVASWEGNVEALLERVGGAFGVSGSANDAAYDWKSWLRLRFLPVYLNFCTAVKAASGKDKTDAVSLAGLTPQAKVDIAQAVYSSKGVWRVEYTPWPGYALNTDSSSVESNFQALKEQAKKTVLAEQVGAKDGRGGSGKDNGTGVTDGTAKGGMFSRAWESTKKAAGDFLTGLGDATGLSKVGASIGEAAYNAVNGSGPSMLAGGRSAGQVGDGTGGKLDELPMPKGEGRWEFFRELFEKVAKIVGVDPKLMATMSAIESGFQSSVKAGTSSATGLFQFISSTWNSMMRKYGAKFGIPQGTPATDPRANALLGAAYIKENMQALKGVKPDVADTDVYMAHFLGAGGAKKFFRLQPGEIAANAMPQEAAANKPIFYTPDGRPRTVAEVYALMNSKIRSRGKQFGLDAGTGALSDGAGAGRGSVNPEAVKPSEDGLGSTAGAGRGSVNPAAVIPVDDQSPSLNAGTAAGGAAANETSYSSPVAMGDAGVPTPPSNPIAQRAASLSAQAQAQNEDWGKALGSVGSSMQRSVQLQSDMLITLRAIERLLGPQAQASAGAAAQPQQSAASAQPARELPVAPVSMAKRFV